MHTAFGFRCVAFWFFSYGVYQGLDWVCIADLRSTQIPDQDLDKAHAKRRQSAVTSTEGQNNSTASPSSTLQESPSATETETELDEAEAPVTRKHRRRLSTFESTDGYMDPENDRIGGSARVVTPRTDAN